MRLMVRIVALSALLVVPSVVAGAQNYPDRPIHAIASQGPGGLSDLFMRVLADKLRSALGQNIVVENHTGASGTIGARACAEAAPDGYTVCILPAEPILINPLIFKFTGFDPKTKLVPITRLFYLTQVLAVNASLNVNSVDELIKLTKAKPKTMSYMAPSLAKVAFMEHLNKTYGTDFVRVPFKGGGDAVNNMLSGTTPIAIFGIGNLIQLMRAGRITGLVIDGVDNKRSPLAPQIPTFAEAGFKIDVAPSFFGLYAPAGTPAPIIDRLYREIAKVGSDPEFQKQHMILLGLSPVFSPPAQFAKELEAERVSAIQVVKNSGLYPNVK